jgi:hypothetical protein
MSANPSHASSADRASAAANKVVDAIRQQVAVSKEVLEAAKHRRDLVRKLAKQHPAARGAFNSGSVAHGTANAPLHDTDCGVVLDRRKFAEYGPDGADRPPGPMLESFRDWILPSLRREYPAVTCEITKRALLFEFGETLELEGGVRVDPSVDLIVALDRRDRPGLWIPNTERPGWDPSHPQRHTELFVSTEPGLRVHRARVVRLAKVAVKNDGEHKVMCSFNIEALALELVTETAPIAAGLADFLLASSQAIRISLTDDPAHVSGPIKLPDGITRQTASGRLAELGAIVAASLEADSAAKARRILSAVFAPQLDDMHESERQGLHNALDARDGIAVATLLGSPRPHKPRRSYGV